MAEKKSDEKIHSRVKGNIEIEYYKTQGGYKFIVFVYNMGKTKVLDNSPSEIYHRLGDCLFSGIIQFYNLKAVHG